MFPAIKASSRQGSILDFDCEARPLSWLGGDFVTKEVTAIAWSFIGSGVITVLAIGRNGVTQERMLDEFLTVYNQADMVTGHYIRGYDLPTINASLIENAFESLGPKMTHDTKLDLLKFQGVSKSQESLGAMLGIDAPKVTMTQDDWRSANRLTAYGIEKTVERVVGDVRQHMEMRAALLREGWLAAPRMWSPGPSYSVKYVS